MWAKIAIRLKKEKEHFDSLGTVVKQLLYSYAMFLSAGPILGLFINAYFWRQSNDLLFIAAYNGANFVGLPIAFYINGVLLRKFNILKLYWIGCILQGLAGFMAIFIPDLTVEKVLIYGFINGVGSGFFWANKNYITLKITKGRNRLYYNNIESSLDMIVGIIIPLAVGWFIVLGEQFKVYSIEVAYKILMVLALALLTVSGYMLQSADIYSGQIKRIVVKNSLREWNRNRVVQIIFWMLGGINFFIPSILVLMFVGEEGSLGTVESVTAALVALLLYVVGRKSKPHHLLWIVGITSTIFFVATILYNLTFGLVGALIYTVIYSLTAAVTFNAIYSNSMEVMDKIEDENEEISQYALVFDNELFFNCGRMIGMFILFYIAAKTTQEMSLRITPVILGALQFVMLWPLSYLVRYVGNKPSVTGSVVVSSERVA